MGREAMIRADMESVGTYNPIFESTIKQLPKRSASFPGQKKSGGLTAAKW